MKDGTLVFITTSTYHNLNVAWDVVQATSLYVQPGELVVRPTERRRQHLCRPPRSISSPYHLPGNEVVVSENHVAVVECAAGQFGAGGLELCKACPPGRKAPYAGLSQCEKCEMG